MRYTLVSDGSSDRCLIPIITWTLAQAVPQRSELTIVEQYADGVRGELTLRLSEAYQRYPCEILFVHRDAEGEAVEKRISEIRSGASQMGLARYVPVVPVRMSEAWLLTDEQAIRQAAGNPHGTQKLSLPGRKRIEDVSDPKEVLHKCLIEASQKSVRPRPCPP
ncbi:MAG: hypothetical protein M3O15_04885 [Acidobacteriota bacterium]|nr:hypothetical protein [Acidobacteriota bacterium]